MEMRLKTKEKSFRNHKICGGGKRNLNKKSFFINKKRNLTVNDNNFNEENYMKIEFDFLRQITDFDVIPEESCFYKDFLEGSFWLSDITFYLLSKCQKQTLPINGRKVKFVSPYKIGNIIIREDEFLEQEAINSFNYSENDWNEYDYIQIPICMNNHWTLCTIIPKYYLIYYWDSFGNDINSFLLNKIINTLQQKGLMAQQ